jgi:hypothetical protein
MIGIKHSSKKKQKRIRLEVTKAHILDKKLQPPGMPPHPWTVVTQSQTSLSQSSDVVLER